MKYLIHSIALLIFILSTEVYEQLTVTVTVRNPAPAQLSI